MFVFVSYSHAAKAGNDSHTYCRTMACRSSWSPAHVHTPAAVTSPYISVVTTATERKHSDI